MLSVRYEGLSVVGSSIYFCRPSGSMGTYAPLVSARPPGGSPGSGDAVPHGEHVVDGLQDRHSELAGIVQADIPTGAVSAAAATELRVQILFGWEAVELRPRDHP
jgi:hypothetical protein